MPEPATDSRRLLVASLSPGRGGAEDYAATVAIEAAHAGWQVTLAAPEGEQMQPVFEQLRINGVRHTRVPAAAKGRQDNVAGVLGFVAVIARNRPHVALIVLPWPRFASAQLLSCALLNVPTVVVFQLVPADVESLRRQIEPRDWMFHLAKRRQTWIAVSEHARATVARLFDFPLESIGRIYNGVDLEKFGSSEPGPGAEAADVRSSLGVDGDETVILSVGRLSEQKCFDDLLAAFANVLPARPDARLVIAGEGPERDRLEQLFSSLGLKDRARLLGNVENPHLLYRAADLFVLPSRYEGFPFAMLEAMAAGLPVVATRFGGADEIVEDGREGLLVPTGDVAGLAGAIEAVLGDRGRMASMAASARIKAQRFSKAGMIEQTLAVLDRTASTGRRQPFSGLRART